jgi:hypothetical protein
VRRFLSFVLLLAFGLPVVSPALGQTGVAYSNLPACCRRDGAHKCVMSPEQIEKLLHGDQFNAVHGKCPCCPTAPVSLHHEVLALHSGGGHLPAAVSQPAKFRQIEAWARVALAGARHKRGPPSVRLS